MAINNHFNILRVFAFCMIFGMAPMVSADMIRLKNGQSMEGKVVKETDHEVTVEAFGGQITLNRKDIIEIEKMALRPEKVKEMAPAKAGPKAKTVKRKPRALKPVPAQPKRPRKKSFFSGIVDKVNGVVSSVKKRRDQDWGKKLRTKAGTQKQVDEYKEPVVKRPVPQTKSIKKVGAYSGNTQGK